MNRFERSIRKLYNAFVSGELNAMNCSACGAGTLCGNNSVWAVLRPKLGFITHKEDHEYEELMMPDRSINISIARAKEIVKNESEYSPEELIMIEKVFIKAMGYNSITGPDSFDYNMCSDAEKEHKNFLGLCGLVDYLAELDNVENPMDFKSLFAKEKELEEVFV